MWFITKNNGKYDIRFCHTVLRKNIEYDNMTTHLVVHMENNLNSIDAGNSGLSEIKTDKFFDTEKKAQMEIIRLEKFEIL